MENWNSKYDCAQTEEVGKVFGSRGRGFHRNFDNNDHDSRVGGTMHNHGFKNGFDQFNKSEKENYWEKNPEARSQNGFKRKDFTTSNEKSKPNKPKSTYVPDAPTEDDDEIFGNHILSGINFDKYDDIEVKVSGENPPKAISSFECSGLQPYIVCVIKKCNYKKPTPIQKFCIPIILSERDMMACAQTGSGKTAAFLIPIISHLLEEKAKFDMNSCCKPLTLIVAPTRELSIQIFDEARKFSRGSSLKVSLIYGGTAVQHQINSIKNGCHILVATPGRLLDFAQRNLINFSEIKFLVLDEADRMLDQGFFPEMKRLVTHPTMPPQGKRQTLMFSATFPHKVQELAEMFLHNYLFVAVGIVGGACTDVEQKFYSVTKFEKRNKLIELLTTIGSSKCLIFVELKRATDFIATFLCEKNFPATSIHGDREQREREEALRDFKTGRMDILVATSVAARGLDIKNVAHVINFDLPNTIDEYVHRIGRTGRVGNRGLATSFYDPDRDANLAPALCKILRQSGQEVPEFLNECPDDGLTFDKSNFGGNDYRNNLGSARETTFEDEVW